MIPFSVIGGFLGAGKTTLLNHWLRHAGGRRFAVLVNDFGAVNIDADLVASQAGDTIALSNGCVCCSIGDDLSAALIRLLQGETRFDAVVVEASGVSDPWRIAQIGLADPDLVLDGVIVVVDASAALRQVADPLLADSIERPLQHADLVVLNKSDAADADTRLALHGWVRRQAPRATVLDATQARVPMALLSSLALPQRPAQPFCHHCGEVHDDPLAPTSAHGHDQPHHELQFETWHWQPAEIFDTPALRAALNDLPPGVLRLKGFVRSPQGWSELQFAGRQGSVRRAPQAPAGGPALVAIGLRGRLPAGPLQARLAKAQVSGRPAAPAAAAGHALPQPPAR